jgi:hypothetical protein
LLKQFKSLKV